MTMKRRLLSVLFVVVGLCAWAPLARADILLSMPVIRTGAACTGTACGAGVFEWDYLAGLSQNETLSSAGVIPGAAPEASTLSNTTKDFFTILDFAGYIPG